MLKKKVGHPLYWFERRGWSVHARQWDDCLQLADYREGMQKVVEWLAPERAEGRGGRVLDLGCGTGNFSLALARDGWETLGVDWAPGMLEKCRAKAAAEPGLKASFQRGDFNRPLPFADGEFDHAICIAAMQCLVSPEAFAREVRRVVRPGGVFVTVFRDRTLNEAPRPAPDGQPRSYVKPSLKWRILTSLKAYARRNADWVRRYSRGEMAALLEGAGFQVLDVHPFYPNTLALVARAGGPRP